METVTMETALRNAIGPTHGAARTRSPRTPQMAVLCARSACAHSGNAASKATRRAGGGGASSVQQLCAPTASPLRRQQQLGAEAPLWGPGPRGPVVVTWRPFVGGRSTHCGRRAGEGRPCVPISSAAAHVLIWRGARTEGEPGVPCAAMGREARGARPTVVLPGALAPARVVRAGLEARKRHPNAAHAESG